MAKRKGRKQQATLGSVVVVLILLAVWYFLPPAEEAPAAPAGQTAATLADIPDYGGEPNVELCGNEPDFTEADLTETSFETYS